MQTAEKRSRATWAQYKYLLEVIGLYPPTAAVEAEAAQGDDLAKSLLKNFEFPNRLPEEEEGAEIAAPAAVGGDSVE